MHRPALLLLAAPALAVAVAVGSASAALAATSGASTEGANGANEVGKVGDPVATAKALFSFDTTTNQLCYTVTATSLQAVAMHIHKGVAGANGPVVVPLDPTRIGAGKTCIAVAAALLADIAAYPGGYYFNAHTAAYPAGALRGQLESLLLPPYRPPLVGTAPTTTPTTSPAATTPTVVAAGNGGQSQDPSSTLPIALVLVGGAAVGTAGWRLARR